MNMTMTHKINQANNTAKYEEELKKLGENHFLMPYFWIIFLGGLLLFIGAFIVLEWYLKKKRGKKPRAVLPTITVEPPPP